MRTEEIVEKPSWLEAGLSLLKILRGTKQKAEQVEARQRRSAIGHMEYMKQWEAKSRARFPDYWTEKDTVARM